MFYKLLLTKAFGLFIYDKYSILYLLFVSRKKKKKKL